MPSKKLRVHFIGIGGIGVSALAQYYLAKGHKVSGSDLVSSEIIGVLRKKGVKIFINSKLKSQKSKIQAKIQNFIKKSNLVIYSPAVPKNHPELIKAKQLKIKSLSYPQALGELTKTHFTIAVSGTHGKSTTTAMVGLLLVKAGLDPTVIVGTKIKEFGNSNCRVGKSQYLVIEADEHFASFLNYWPRIIVLTTIEKDHLDYYKNLNNILRTFKRYIAHLPKNGWLVVNKDDKNTNSKLQIPNYKFQIKKYSLKQPEAKKLKKILKIPGEHNVSNALATLTVARILEIPDKISFKALSEYKGSWRRFEEKICYIPNTRYKIRVISDYGHHPTEIRVTLKAAREKYPKKKIWCVYQPHQYQRTFYLFNDFLKVFKQAPVNKLIITDIYDVAGREEKTIKKKIDSEKLVKKINKPWVVYLPKNKIINYLKKNLRSGYALIIMGAGDIYTLVDYLCLTEKKKRKKI